MIHFSTAKRVLKAYKENFHKSPEHLVQAPGRVNIIGEHTDYNEGFVLPIAINRVVSIAFSTINEPEIRLFSLDFDQYVSISLEENYVKNNGWQEYLKGLIKIYKKNGFKLQGWQGIFSGDVPIGAGLSSSAALELGFSRAIALASNWKWEPQKMALLSQKAENEWVGVNCGIMDQMISALGKIDHALFLDCRSLESTSLALPKSVRIVVLDTDTRRGLVDSEYNDRRNQCETVAQYFGVKALRDLTLEDLEKSKLNLNITDFKRARHVIRENKRVIECVEAIRMELLEKVGELLIDSHMSLRNDFEVSSEELDLIVDLSIQAPGCYGARMTGGGFGGCALALVDEKYIATFISQVKKEYRLSTGKIAKLYVCRATRGATVFSKKKFFIYNIEK